MCGCSALGNAVGQMMYTVEKLVSCCALTAVIWCTITTMMVMLAVGTGLGYNYCIVDLKAHTFSPPPTTTTKTTTKKTTSKENTPGGAAPTASTASSEDTTTTTEASTASSEDTTTTEEAWTASSENVLRNLLLHPDTSPYYTSEPLLVATPMERPTIIVPLPHEGGDFSSLLSKLRAEKKNVTVEIVA